MDADTVQRSIANHIGDRELKKFPNLVLPIVSLLEENEQVLGAAAGTSIRRKDCLVVATSRQLITAEEGRVDNFPYDKLIDLEFHESWRKASFVVRVPGGLADVKGVHLDRAREIKRIVETARRTSGSRPNWTSPV